MDSMVYHPFSNILNRLFWEVMGGCVVLSCLGIKMPSLLLGDWIIDSSFSSDLRYQSS